MPEMVASYSSQRFSAMLDFQRDVDLIHPSHIGKKSGSGGMEGLLKERKAQQPNWSDSLSAFLASTFRRETVMAAPRSCAVEAAAAVAPSSYAVARSEGQFSPQKFIRSALKRAFAREGDASVMHVKRARYESTAEPMVCG